MHSLGPFFASPCRPSSKPKAWRLGARSGLGQQTQKRPAHHVGVLPPLQPVDRSIDWEGTVVGRSINRPESIHTHTELLLGTDWPFPIDTHTHTQTERQGFQARPLDRHPRRGESRSSPSQKSEPSHVLFLLLLRCAAAAGTVRGAPRRADLAERRLPPHGQEDPHRLLALPPRAGASDCWKARIKGGREGLLSSCNGSPCSFLLVSAHLKPTHSSPPPRKNAQAKDGPPEKQGSARGELGATLSRIKGKPEREAAVAEVLTILVKELRGAQGERDALKRRTEALVVENREVGAKWQAAVAHNKELETNIEKLDAQMDKTMGAFREWLDGWGSGVVESDRALCYGRMGLGSASPSC
jgi:hypothetical protein